MDLLDRQLEHDHWATAKLLEICRGLPDARLDLPFDIGHRTLRDTVVHIIFNIEYWTSAAAGHPVESPVRERSIAELAGRYERANAAFAAMARRVRDEGRLDDTGLDRFGENPTLGGMIVQVILHNEGHRNEAVHILDRLGPSDPPELDHALWDLSARVAPTP